MTHLAIDITFSPQPKLSRSLGHLCGMALKAAFGFQPTLRTAACLRGEMKEAERRRCASGGLSDRARKRIAGTGRWVSRVATWVCHHGAGLVPSHLAAP